jgi:hypothetical protein
MAFLDSKSYLFYPLSPDVPWRAFCQRPERSKMAVKQTLHGRYLWDDSSGVVLRQLVIQLKVLRRRIERSEIASFKLAPTVCTKNDKSFGAQL